MRDRLNKVLGTFTKCFGLTPDVVFYEDGKIVAFRSFSRKKKYIACIAEGMQNNEVICKVIVDEL